MSKARRSFTDDRKVEVVRRQLHVCANIAGEFFRDGSSG